MSVGYVSDYSPRPARGTNGWLRFVLLGVLLVLGTYALTAPKSIDPRTVATYNGYDCSVAVYECWVIWDWNISAFGSVEGRYTITLQPGARVYCRWETNARFYPATSFYNAGTATTSNNMSSANSTYVRLVVSTSDSTASYHCWTDAATTGRFAITNSRFITTAPDFNGTATGQPTIVPGPTVTANPYYTYCPAPTPTGYIGPAIPSVCALPTPTAPPATAPCNAGYGTGGDVVQSIGGGFQGVCSLAETSGKEYRVVITSLTATAGDLPAYINNNRIFSIGLIHDGSSTTPTCCTYWPNAGMGGGVWRWGGGDGGTDIAFTGGSGSTRTWTGSVATTWTGVDAPGSHWLYVWGSWGFSCNGNSPPCGGSATYRIEVRDVGASTAAPAPTATAAPTTPPYVAPSEPPPPPDNGGFAFPTRFNANICPLPRPSPEIAACAAAATRQPSMIPFGSPNASAAQKGLTDVYDHLMSKAPFGYLNQAATALGGSLTGAAGSNMNWCSDVVFMGQTKHWCIADYSSNALAGGIRTLLLAIVTVIFAFGLFSILTKAPDGG